MQCLHCPLKRSEKDSANLAQRFKKIYNVFLQWTPYWHSAYTFTLDVVVATKSLKRAGSCYYHFLLKSVLVLILQSSGLWVLALSCFINIWRVLIHLRKIHPPLHCTRNIVCVCLLASLPTSSASRSDLIGLLFRVFSIGQSLSWLDAHSLEAQFSCGNNMLPGSVHLI